MCLGKTGLFSSSESAEGSPQTTHAERPNGLMEFCRGKTQFQRFILEARAFQQLAADIVQCIHPETVPVIGRLSRRHLVSCDNGVSGIRPCS